MGFPSLGATKALRDELYSSGDYENFFKRYRDSINGNEQVGELYRYIEDGKKIALLCFEHDANKCHRKILAEQIKRQSKNGFKIKHIAPVLGI